MLIDLRLLIFNLAFSYLKGLRVLTDNKFAKGKVSYPTKWMHISMSVSHRTDVWRLGNNQTAVSMTTMSMICAERSTFQR
jgi:hypothetical protein